MLRAITLLIVLPFTSATFATQIVIDSLAAKAENTGSGWVVTSSSGTFGVGISQFTSVQRRGLLEYSLAGIPDTADVLSASLQINIYFYNNPPLANVQLNGYIGDGNLSVADVTVPLNDIGRTGAISSLGTRTVALDAAYIESVLAAGHNWLGVMAHQLVASGSTGYTAGNGYPQLAIEYVPEPATLVLGLLMILLLRRR